MDLNEFHKLCLRTEADDHAMQASRLLDSNGIVVESLAEFSQVAIDLDVLKKHVFYGNRLDPDDQRVVEGVPGALTSEQWARFAERIRLVHAVIGLITEADELLNGLMEYVMEGKDLDRVNVLEECCDATWYLNLALDSVGFTAADVPRTLIPKLEARYERKFNAQKALNRNLEVERACLEASASGDTATPSGDQEATGG